MSTECTPESLHSQEAHGRDVVARFDGGTLTSDAGTLLLLLREAERATGMLRQFTACFTDHRDAARVEHPVTSLVAQRVYGLALGYEDLFDMIAALQDAATRWLWQYNHEHPDMGIGGVTPMQRLAFAA